MIPRIESPGAREKNMQDARRMALIALSWRSAAG